MQKQKTVQKKKKERKQIVVMTNIRDVINNLLKMMKKHIGKENKISHRQLFKKVYGMNPEEVSELHEWMLWEFIKRAMHRLRQRTKCFIVSKQIPTSRFSRGGVWHYWVAQDMEDFIVYRNNIERNVKAMRAMVNKCHKAVRDKWYQEDWKY